MLVFDLKRANNFMPSSILNGPFLSIIEGNRQKIWICSLFHKNTKLNRENTPYLLWCCHFSSVCTPKKIQTTSGWKYGLMQCIVCWKTVLFSTLHSKSHESILSIHFHSIRYLFFLSLFALKNIFVFSSSIILMMMITIVTDGNNGRKAKRRKIQMLTMESSLRVEIFSIHVDEFLCPRSIIWIRSITNSYIANSVYVLNHIFYASPFFLCCCCHNNNSNWEWNVKKKNNGQRRWWKRKWWQQKKWQHEYNNKWRNNICLLYGPSLYLNDIIFMISFLLSCFRSWSSLSMQFSSFVKYRKYFQDEKRGAALMLSWSIRCCCCCCSSHSIWNWNTLLFGMSMIEQLTQDGR